MSHLLTLGVLQQAKVTVEKDGYVYTTRMYHDMGVAKSHIIKINMATMEVDEESAEYIGYLRALAISGDYIYTGGTETQRIRKYNLSDLEYQEQSDDYGGTIHAAVTA